MDATSFVKCKFLEEIKISSIALLIVLYFVLAERMPISMSCGLCSQYYTDSEDWGKHIVQHFGPGICDHCDQQLITINGTIYHLQLTEHCVKIEPNDSACQKTEIIYYEANTDAGKNDTEDEITNDKADDAMDNVDDDFHDNKPEDLPPLDVSAPAVSVVPPSLEPTDGNDDFTWPAFPDDDTDSEPKKEPTPIVKRRRGRPKTGQKYKKKPAIFKYECYMCHKMIRYFPELQRHLQAHSDGLPKCHLCHKEFADKYNLKNHLRTHSDVKRYICSYCGKGFHKSTNMVNHMVTHTGTREHKCDICGKMFGRRYGLINHHRVHTGEKPCKCRIEGCDRAYMYIVDLKRHLYSAHGIYTKKFECNVCGKIYPENKLLVAHMKSHTTKID